jgi:hypothetical protein
VKKSGVTVEFIGYRSLKRALNSAAPDMRKAMDKDIKGVVEPIRKRAKKLAPKEPALSGWARSPVRRKDGTGVFWPRDGIEKSIKVYIPSRGRRKGSDTWLVARRLVQGSSAGAIYTAGGTGGGGNNSPAAVRFRANMNAKHGKPTRSIYKALEEAGGNEKVNRQIIAIMRRW